MNYKAVICDLDGTLLNDEHRVSDYTKEVIQKIIAKGIKLFIATGRHHIDAGEIRGQLGLDTTLITSNGARVHDEAGEEILAYDLSEEIAKGILDLERDDEIHINLYQGDYWLVERENEALHAYHRESGFQYKVVPFHALDSFNLTKIYYTCEDHEKLVALQGKIENLFPERLNVTFSNPNCLEVMAKGVSKGMAISKVLEQHSIHPREAMAFGDGLNDLEMLQVVGKGLIMGNAHDKLKEALSKHEVIQSNDEDGVAKYLERLL